MAVTHSEAVRNGITNHVVDQLDAGGPGKLVLRAAGTITALGAEIATLPFSATAFGASGAVGPAGAGTEPATAGRAYANAITSDTTATAGTLATATFETGASAALVHCSVTAVGDGGDITVGGSGLVVASNATVSCSSLSYTAPA